MSYSGEIEDEVDYNTKSICRERCGSFFECRNEHLILAYEILENEWYEDEDAYTEAEYEEFYGRVEVAESTTNPGSPPKPILE